MTNSKVDSIRPSTPFSVDVIGMVLTLTWPYRKLLIRQVDDLIDTNDKIKGVTSKGFCYWTYYFKYGCGIVHERSNHLPVDKSLVYQAEGLLRHQTQVARDLEYLQRVLRDLVQPCHTIQDLRDVLPECLIQFELTLNRFERTREAAYTASGNTSLQFRYEVALPKFHSYAAMHLLTT